MLLSEINPYFYIYHKIQFIMILPAHPLILLRRILRDQNRVLGSYFLTRFSHYFINLLVLKHIFIVG
jgi:hypothetical protein